MATKKLSAKAVEQRTLRPAEDTDAPNDNPSGILPASVGKPDYNAGDPNGLVIEDDGDPGRPFGGSLLHASPWDGWPAEWNLPIGRAEELTDVAWAALDLNSSVFSSMPPYLVGASPNLPDEWLDNPDPDRYNSWADFAHAAMWDYLLGEVFIVATARFGNGWPAVFHVAPPWTVNVEMDGAGGRSYSIGAVPVDRADMLHIPYRITADSARGTGPLDAGRSRMVAAGVLLRYLTNFVQGGAVPSGVLESEEELSAKQASDLHQQWINARMARLGLPAILDGGVTWRATQTDPLSTAMTALAGYTEAKISTLLGVPPFLLGLPSGGDSLVYQNVQAIFDFHWRGGLRPKAQRIMLALSEWLVPHGTAVEVNRDVYVQPGPYERAQTWEILIRIGVLTAEQVQQIERYAPTASMLATGTGTL